MNTPADQQTRDSATSNSTESTYKQAEKIRLQFGESAQQIWLAGIGALGRVQQRGSRLFDALVQEGEQLERRNRDRVRQNAEAARHRVHAHLDKAKGGARRGWHRLVEQLDEQIHQALARLHVPSHEELEALRQEIAALRAELHQSTTKTPPAQHATLPPQSAWPPQ